MARTKGSPRIVAMRFPRIRELLADAAVVVAHRPTTKKWNEFIRPIGLSKRLTLAVNGPDLPA